MGIREFEVFHGSVLTKLVRSDRPITLRMIETKPGEAWAAYTINDEVELFVKHSTNARPQARQKGAYSWSWVFNPDQIKQMNKLRKKRPVYAALVGGRKSIKRGKMQVCLLNPEQLDRLIDYSNPNAQSVTVKYVPGKQLRVFSDRKIELLVPQSALDQWVVPGN